MTQHPNPPAELVTRLGHALLQSIADGHRDKLLIAADALGKLDDVLPAAAVEVRMVVVLLALVDSATPKPSVAASAPIKRRGKAAAKPREAKPSRIVVDADGKVQPSREVGGIAVISQADARKALGISCQQMLKLEDQRLLERVQEAGMRHVWYQVGQVQRLLDLLDKTTPEVVDATC